MRINHNPALRLLRSSDLFLPLSFLAACLLRRGSAAMGLFSALYAAKLCALTTADGLRATFATQPSMKYVQGSALVALICQMIGAVLSALLLYTIPGTRSLLPLVPCGLFLNIEQVFYEYLYAAGDGKSALACRGITAVLTLLGLLLCMPPSQDSFLASAFDPAWLLVTCGISALIGLFISLFLGGGLHPVPNFEVLRHAPLSMLHTALCPVLMILALALLWPDSFNPAPVFAGLILYEACRTPFRRSPLESGPMNKLLLFIGIAALIGFIVFRFLINAPYSIPICMTCTSLLIAALCAFALFGSIPRRE